MAGNLRTDNGRRQPGNDEWVRWQGTVHDLFSVRNMFFAAKASPKPQIGGTLLCSEDDPEALSVAEARHTRATRRGIALMSIAALLANSSFDPETVEVLSVAFEDAWEKIEQSRSTLARPAYRRGAREVLAKRIIEMAQSGERDKRRLSDAGVAFLAENYRD